MRSSARLKQRSFNACAMASDNADWIPNSVSIYGQLIDIRPNAVSRPEFPLMTTTYPVTMHGRK